MSETEPQEELQSRLASALSLAQRNGYTLHGQALAVLETIAEQGLVIMNEGVILAAASVVKERNEELIAAQQEEQPND